MGIGDAEGEEEGINVVNGDGVACKFGAALGNIPNTDDKDDEDERNNEAYWAACSG